MAQSRPHGGERGPRTPNGNRKTQERGKGLVLPGWWLDLVQEIFDDREEGTVVTGKKLAEAIGRGRAWDHSSVSRFLEAKVTTREMAEAFAILYGLPQLVYKARSMEEAFALQGIAKKYDVVAASSNPERERRLAITDQVAAAEQEHARDQTRGLPSTNEGIGRSRRTRRVARRGASSS